MVNNSLGESFEKQTNLAGCLLAYHVFSFFFN